MLIYQFYNSTIIIETISENRDSSKVPHVNNTVAINWTDTTVGIRMIKNMKILHVFVNELVTNGTIDVVDTNT